MDAFEASIKIRSIKIEWSPTNFSPARQFQCGYCHRDVGAIHGMIMSSPHLGVEFASLLFCPSCFCPTIKVDHDVFPTPYFGQSLDYAPEGLKRLYNEARSCFHAGSYTAAALLCRKMLMNIAVHEGAREGEHFTYYVKYLADNHLAPPKSDVWIDEIRKKGNEATHEIEFSTKEEAQNLIVFTWSLLHFLYELHGQMQPAPVA